MSNFYEHVGPWGVSASNVVFITIAVVAVIGLIYVRFVHKW